MMYFALSCKSSCKCILDGSCFLNSKRSENSTRYFSERVAVGIPQKCLKYRFVRPQLSKVSLVPKPELTKLFLAHVTEVEDDFFGATLVVWPQRVRKRHFGNVANVHGAEERRSCFESNLAANIQ